MTLTRAPNGGLSTLTYWILGAMLAGLGAAIGWGQHLVEMRLTDQEKRITAVQNGITDRNDRVTRIEAAYVDIQQNQKEIKEAIIKLDEKLDWLSSSATTAKVVNVPDWQRRLDAIQNKRLDTLEKWRIATAKQP